MDLQSDSHLLLDTLLTALGGAVKKQNQSSEKEIPFFSEIITCNPSTYQMDHPDKTVSNFMEKSNGLQMVNKAYQ